MGFRDQLRAAMAAATGGRLVSLAEAQTARPGTPPLTPVAEPTTYGGHRPVRAQAVVRGMTPARIATILREADDGDPARFHDLLREIEDRDLHLLGVLASRKRAVANLAWQVVPSGTTDRDVAIAAWAQEQVANIGNLEDGFMDLLDAVHQGVAFVELNWQRVGRAVVVESLDYRPQGWFLPNPENIREWRVRDVGHPIGLELPAYRFICHTSQAKSGFNSQKALGRTLLWWWLFKNVAMKDWATYSELFGAPLRVGKYPAGSKPDDVDAMYDALVRLGVDAVAAIPADMQIEFVTASNSGSGDVQERLVRFCDRAISKGVLGQTLTTEADETGTQALGTVHEGVRQDILVSDAKQLARTLTRDLVRPLVLFQWGNQVAPPRFEFLTEPEADRKVEAEGQEIRAKVFAAARQLGVPVTLQQVQQELGIRPAGAGDELLPPLPTSTPFPQTPSADATASEVQTPGRQPASRTRGAGVLHRCPICTGTDGALALAEPGDPNLPPILQQLDDATDRYLAEGGTAAWDDLVASMRQALLADAATIEEVEPRFRELVAQLGPDHPQLAAVAANLADATLTADLVGQLQVFQADVVVTDLPQVPPREAIAYWTTKLLVTPDEFQAMAAAHRSRAFSIAGFTSLDALSKVHQVFQTSLEGGATLAEFEDAIALDGVFLTPAHLQNVYRTNIGTAYAVGRDTEQRRPRTLERRPFWRYNGIDDRRTRRTHRLQQGVVLRYDDPYWSVWSPPNGYLCRCYRTAHSAEELGLKGWEVAEGPAVDPLTGLAPTPDEGFRTDPAATPDTLAWIDWGRLPPDWQPLIQAELRPAPRSEAR